MQKLRAVLDKIMEFIMAAFMGIMTIMVTWQVVTRYCFNKPNPYTEALSKYMFVWLVMLASSYVFGKREHMNIPIVMKSFSQKIQVVCGIISETVIMLVGLTVQCYGGWLLAMQAMNQADMALAPLTMGQIYMILPISGVLTAIYAFTNIITIIKNGSNNPAGKDSV